MAQETGRRLHDVLQHVRELADRDPQPAQRGQASTVDIRPAPFGPRLSFPQRIRDAEAQQRLRQDEAGRMSTAWDPPSGAPPHAAARQHPRRSARRPRPPGPRDAGDLRRRACRRPPAGPGAGQRRAASSANGPSTSPSNATRSAPHASTHSKQAPPRPAISPRPAPSPPRSATSSTSHAPKPESSPERAPGERRGAVALGVRPRCRTRHLRPAPARHPRSRAALRRTGRPGAEVGVDICDIGAGPSHGGPGGLRRIPLLGRTWS